MKKIKIACLLMTAGLLANGCGDRMLGGEGNQSASKISAKSLQGEWKWVKTEGAGIAGPYQHTAAETGNSETLKFSIDGTVEINRINSGIETDEIYSFVVSREESQYLVSYFQDGNLVRRQFIERSGTNIIFSNYEPCCDNNYSALYRR